MMNPNGSNPFWGGNLYCSDDAAATEMSGLIDMDDPLAITDFRRSGDSSPMQELSFTDVLVSISDRKPLTMESEPGPQIVGSQYALEQVKRENYGIDSEGLDRLLTEVCGTTEPTYHFRVAKVAQGNEKKNSKIFTMVNETELYAKPEKDIPIQVVGAKFGQRVLVSMRYKAGRHYDTPVRPCPEHSKTNPDFTFSVPRLAVEKVMDDNGHPTLKVPVPSLNSGEDFDFSILFHCRNSCHKQQGKEQEMILQLCDSVDGGRVLHEYRIDIRICENVNRDIGVRNDKLHLKKEVKRLRGRNMKMVSPKRNKTEGEQEGLVATACLPVDQPISETPCSFVIRLPNGTFYKPIADLVKAMKGSVYKLEEHEAPPLP